MNYSEAYDEMKALKSIGKDYNFAAMTRLDMARRLQRLQKALRPHEEAHNAWVVQNKLEGKPMADVDEKLKAEYKALMEAECPLPNKRWTQEQLQLSVNQIPLDVLSVLLTEE